MSAAWTEQVAQTGGHAGVVLHLLGDFDLELAPTVRRLATKAIADGPAYLLVDLSQVDYLSEYGVAALLLLRSRAADQEVPLVLAHPHGQVESRMRTSWLTQYFDIEFGP